MEGRGGRVLLDEAMPSLVASAAIFANAPDGTKAVQLSVYNQGIYLDQAGGTATSADHFLGITTQAPYTIVADLKTLKAMKAIQAAATATGKITYWG